MTAVAGTEPLGNVGSSGNVPALPGCMLGRVHTLPLGVRMMGSFRE